MRHAAGKATFIAVVIISMAYFLSKQTMPSISNILSGSHVRHGIKVGLASALAYFISDLVGLPYAFWAVVSTVIVMQMHVADSIDMCFYRFTGTAIGAVIGTLAILVFPPTPFFTLLGIFIATGLCAYLTRYNARFRMAAITVGIVYLTSLGSASDERVLFALFRVLEIGVGVACAFVVSVAVWPHRTGAALRERLEDQFDRLADCYSILMGNFVSRQKKVDPDMLFELVAEAQKNREMFHKVFVTERRFFRDDTRLLSLQVSVLNSVLERLQAMPILLNEVDGVGYDIIMAPELMELTRATVVALRDVGQGKSHDPTRLRKAVAVIEPRFIELRRQGVTERFGAQRMFQVLGFINGSQHLGEYVLEVLNKVEDIQKS